MTIRLDQTPQFKDLEKFVLNLHNQGYTTMEIRAKAGRAGFKPLKPGAKMLGVGTIEKIKNGAYNRINKRRQRRQPKSTDFDTQVKTIRKQLLSGANRDSTTLTMIKIFLNTSYSPQEKLQFIESIIK